MEHFGSHEALVEHLVQTGYLSTQYYIDIFSSVDKKLFVPKEYETHAYDDACISIEGVRSTTQPSIAALLIEFLAPSKGERILEIGTGFGWVTAILAKSVATEQKGEDDGVYIYSCDTQNEILETAKKNCESYDESLCNDICFFVGDGIKGGEKYAPFDKIISTGAVHEIPKSWKEQLKIGGRIVAPMNNTIVVLTKISKEEYGQKSYIGYEVEALFS